MGYFKTIEDDIIVSISTIDGVKGNIDEKEFLMLKELFNKMPTDKMLRIQARKKASRLVLSR